MVFNLTKMKEQLNNSVREGKISKNTANLYLYAVRTLNDNLEDNASSEEIAEAIRFYCATYIDDAKAAVSFYEKRVMCQWGCLLTPTDRAKLKGGTKVKELTYSPRYYRDRIRRSNHRLAWTLQERSGLRLSEVAALTPNDIIIDGDDILINVRHGKGDKQRFVNCLYSKYLLENLPNFEKMPPESTLYSEAARLGFSTHDLRKVNARTRYWMERENGKTKQEALKVVQAELGHEKTKETIDYLGREWSKRKNDAGF